MGVYPSGIFTQTSTKISATWQTACRNLQYKYIQHIHTAHCTALYTLQFGMMLPHWKLKSRELMAKIGSEPWEFIRTHLNSFWEALENPISSCHKATRSAFHLRSKWLPAKNSGSLAISVFPKLPNKSVELWELFQVIQAVTSWSTSLVGGHLFTFERVTDHHPQKRARAESPEVHFI